MICSPSVARATPKPTRAATIAADIREDILSGRLLPGERLVFPELCRRYDASVGAIREALVSLVSRGLVTSKAHQGYEVTVLSHDELLGLTSARLWIEPIILRDSIEHGDLDWEGRVVNTHHVMSRTPLEEPSGGGRSTAWAAAHEAFHNALLSGSSNRRMLAIAAGFAEEAALYRRWASPLEVHRDVSSEHLGIMEAALERNPDLAAERLRDHISLTTKLLIEHSHEIVVSGKATDDASQDDGVSESDGRRRR
jgi:DNA-binding GntR family transcriptional regulator